jgi:preprotein translocase subunit SecA
MSVINSLLKIFVGDKKQQDLKKLQPIVGQVHSYGSTDSRSIQ